MATFHRIVWCLCKDKGSNTMNHSLLTLWQSKHSKLSWQRTSFSTQTVCIIWLVGVRPFSAQIRLYQRRVSIITYHINIWTHRRASIPLSQKLLDVVLVRVQRVDALHQLCPVCLNTLQLCLGRHQLATFPLYLVFQLSQPQHNITISTCSLVTLSFLPPPVLERHLSE